MFHNAANGTGYQGASHTAGQDAGGEQNQNLLPGLRQQQVDEPEFSIQQSLASQEPALSAGESLLSRRKVCYVSLLFTLNENTEKWMS